MGATQAHDNKSSADGQRGTRFTKDDDDLDCLLLHRLRAVLPRRFSSTQNGSVLLPWRNSFGVAAVDGGGRPEAYRRSPGGVYRAQEQVSSPPMLRGYFVGLLVYGEGGYRAGRIELYGGGTPRARWDAVGTSTAPRVGAAEKVNGLRAQVHSTCVPFLPGTMFSTPLGRHASHGWRLGFGKDVGRVGILCMVHSSGWFGRRILPSLRQGMVLHHHLLHVLDFTVLPYRSRLHSHPLPLAPFYFLRPG